MSIVVVLSNVSMAMTTKPSRADQPVVSVTCTLALRLLVVMNSCDRESFDRSLPQARPCKVFDLQRFATDLPAVRAVFSSLWNIDQIERSSQPTQEVEASYV